MIVLGNLNTDKTKDIMCIQMLITKKLWQLVVLENESEQEYNHIMQSRITEEDQNLKCKNNY